MDLSKANTNDLKEELERREREEEETRVPKSLEVKDFDGVVTHCVYYIHRVSEGYSGLSDEKRYIFEAALEAVYGKDIWKYVNNKLR